MVEDRGDGVAPEFVPRLFQRFSRGDEAQRQGLPGAGLGLAIASAYVRAVGGSLLRTSEPVRRPLHVHAAGSSNVKIEPSRSLDSTQIVPFILRTSSRQM